MKFDTLDFSLKTVLTRHKSAAHILACTHFGFCIYMLLFVSVSFLRLRSGCVIEDGSIAV